MKTLSPAIILTRAEENLFAAARLFAKQSERQHTVATIHEMCREDEEKTKVLLNAAEAYAVALAKYRGDEP